MSSRRGTLVVGIGFGALACLALFAALNRKDERVGRGEEIRYDDFGFTVRGVRKIPTLGDGGATAVARGIFYVVTLQVANHAIRVDFRFDPSVPRIVDGSGKRYGLSEEGRRAIVASHGGTDPCEVELPPGSSCVTELPFDVPADIREPRLMLRFGGWAGETLDLVFLGRKRIRLD